MMSQLSLSYGTIYYISKLYICTIDISSIDIFPFLKVRNSNTNFDPHFQTQNKKININNIYVT